MSRYMMFINHSEDYRNRTVPQALYDAMGEFVQKSMKSGNVIDTAGLLPTSEGTRVRLSKGKLKVTDGPFTEAKEVIGGFAIFEFKSREEAIEAAAHFMELSRKHWPGWEGECEVRQMWSPDEDFPQAEG